MRIKAFAEKVSLVAGQTVGAFENGVLDGSEENPTRDELFACARADVLDECPREVRFLGAEDIAKLVYEQVDRYEFRTW